MRRNRPCGWALWCVVVVATAALVSVAWSAPRSGGDRYLVVATAPQRLTADGDLADWKALGQDVVIDRDHLAGGWLDGTPDARARLRLAYDADHLWIALSVVDASVLGLKKPSRQPGKFWEQDGAGLYLDVPGINVASGRYQTRPTRPWTARPILQLTPGTGDHGRAVLPAGSRYGCRMSAKGYTVEAAVPWRSLGWEPRAGERILFGAILADIDRTADGKTGPLKQVIWHMGADDMSSSRTWAQARLVTAGGFGGEILCASRTVRRGAPLSWKLLADASTSGWTIRNVTLNKAGITAATLTDKPAVVVPGQTLSLGGEAPADTLKPGTYQIRAVAMKGGQAQPIVQAVVVADPSVKLVQHKPARVPQQLLIADPLRSGARARGKHTPISHATYRAFVDEEMKVGWPAFQYHLRVKTALGGGWYLEYGLRLAAYAKVTGDPVWAKRAQQMFEMANAQFRAKKYAGLGWINMPLIYYYKQYLTAVKAWKPGYDAMVCDWYLHTWPGFPKDPKQVWQGMNNWGLSSAIGV